jgi:hypothetical protein
MSKMKVTPIDEVNWGLYAWMMPDETLVMDEEGGYLSIPSMKGDIRQLKQLNDAAKYHGIEDGHPVFFAGHRPVDNEELETQKQRMELGLVPDVMDTPAMLEYYKEMKEMNLD